MSLFEPKYMLRVIEKDAKTGIKSSDYEFTSEEMVNLATGMLFNGFVLKDKVLNFEVWKQESSYNPDYEEDI